MSRSSKINKLPRQYPKGWGKYKKLTAKWEKYVEDKIYASFVKQFPNTRDMTIIKVARMLVEHKWIEEVQRYVYLSAVAGGYTGKFKDFQKEMSRLKTEDGIVNAWANSYEREVAKRMIKRMKKHDVVLKKRAKNISKIDEPSKYLYNNVKAVGSKELLQQYRKLEQQWDTLTAKRQKEQLKNIKDIVVEDITVNKYNELAKETTEKVNEYQGKFLSKDALVRENNKQTEKQYKKNETKIENSDKKLVQVGYWRLSPEHQPHYYPDGEDPCEIHALHNEGYGPGGYTGDNIKIPVIDSHFGCKCSVELVVVEKK